MYMESGPLAGGYGLSWREGDDLKSVKGEHASIKTAQVGSLSIAQRAHLGEHTRGKQQQHQDCWGDLHLL